MTDLFELGLASAFRAEATRLAADRLATYSCIDLGAELLQRLAPRDKGAALEIELRSDYRGSDLFLSADGRHLATVELTDPDAEELRMLLDAAASGEVRMLCVSGFGRTKPMSIAFGGDDWALSIPVGLSLWPLRKELRFTPWPRRHT